MRKMTKRSAAIVTGAVLAVAGGTAAFAYASGWFSGSSTVYASASEIRPINVVIDTRSTGNLYPGKVMTVPTVDVNNTNDYPVMINGITVSSVSTSSGAACDADDADLVFFDVTPARLDTGLHAVSLGKITMQETANPACAGLVMTITAALTGEIAPAA
jgi:hypothetical protein